MCKDEASVTESVTKAKKPVPKQLTPFTTENAKEMARRAAYCKSLRAQARQKMLEAVLNEGVDKYIVKAIKSNDPNMMTIVEKAMKLVGIDFASSEESVQRVQANVEAKTDNKVVVEVKGLDG